MEERSHFLQIMLQFSFWTFISGSMKLNTITLKIITNFCIMLY